MSQQHTLLKIVRVVTGLLKTEKRVEYPLKLVKLMSVMMNLLVVLLMMNHIVRDEIFPHSFCSYFDAIQGALVHYGDQ